MGPESILIMLFVFKHMVADWWLQPGWMCFNKHKLNHWGGYAHSGVNVLGTVVALGFFGFFGSVQPGWLMMALLLGEFVCHFVMDYVKMNVTIWMKWDMTKDPEFWWWTGFDQFVHYAYLVFMAGMLV